MPRRAAPSTHLLARVRAWFGLSQAELALYLASSQTLVQAIESGQRRLGADLLAALRPLAQHLPPLGPEVLAPPPLPDPDPVELDFRYRTCQQQAARLARELAQLEQQARLAQRWAQALLTLLPGLPSSTPTEASILPDPERTAWLAGWLTRRAHPLPPPAATRLRLLRARLAGLHAEMADLLATG